jgi:hypothetical protein
MGSVRSSAAVRLALVLALPILAASLTGCSGGSRAAVQVAPSGFAVEPRVSDPLCNGGRGVRLPVRFGGNPIVASATVANGSTLIAISDYSARRSFVLHSVTRRCAPNLDFGRHGVATIGISSRSPRTRPASGAPSGLRIRAVAARNGGGAILAGGFGSNWVVGEVNRSGQIDRTFGNGGWEVLPFHGEATAIVQEPSGRIVIGVPRRPRHGRRQVAVCRPNTTDVDGAPPRRLDRSSLRQPRPRTDSHALAGTVRSTRHDGPNQPGQPQHGRSRRMVVRA